MAAGADTVALLVEDMVVEDTRLETSLVGCMRVQEAERLTWW